MIYIVTPVFNRKKFTANYLDALSKQTMQDFKIIIVDDGSTDGTSEMIESNFPDTILLRERGGDLWWTAATNIGVRHALNQGDTTYIMTLNDDTLPRENFMEIMMLSAKENPRALLGAFTLDVNSGKPIYAGHIIDWKKCAFNNLLKTEQRSEFKGLREVNVYPGRGLLIPKEVFDNIGYYDEKNFPQTVADEDFTVRASNFGYTIYCNYDAIIEEYPEESGGVQLRKNKSWKNYYNHLFGMRGVGNIKFFTIFAIKNAPRKYLLQCLVIGNARRVAGYLRDWIKEIISGESSNNHIY